MANIIFDGGNGLTNEDLFINPPEYEYVDNVLRHLYVYKSNSSSSEGICGNSYKTNITITDGIASGFGKYKSGSVEITPFLESSDTFSPLGSYSASGGHTFKAQARVKLNNVFFTTTETAGVCFFGAHKPSNTANIYSSFLQLSRFPSNNNKIIFRLITATGLLGPEMTVTTQLEPNKFYTFVGELVEFIPGSGSQYTMRHILSIYDENGSLLESQTIDKLRSNSYTYMEGSIRIPTETPSNYYTSFISHIDLNQTYILDTSTDTLITTWVRKR